MPSKGGLNLGLVSKMGTTPDWTLSLLDHDGFARHHHGLASRAGLEERIGGERHPAPNEEREERQPP